MSSVQNDSFRFNSVVGKITSNFDDFKFQISIDIRSGPIVPKIGMNRVL